MYAYREVVKLDEEHFRRRHRERVTRRGRTLLGSVLFLVLFGWWIALSILSGGEDR